MYLALYILELHCESAPQDTKIHIEAVVVNVDTYGKARAGLIEALSSDVYIPQNTPIIRVEEQSYKEYLEIQKNLRLESLNPSEIQWLLSMKSEKEERSKVYAGRILNMRESILPFSVLLSLCSESKTSIRRWDPTHRQFETATTRLLREIQSIPLDYIIIASVRSQNSVIYYGIYYIDSRQTVLVTPSDLYNSYGKGIRQCNGKINCLNCRIDGMRGTISGVDGFKTTDYVISAKNTDMTNEISGILNANLLSISMKYPNIGERMRCSDTPMEHKKNLVQQLRDLVSRSGWVD